MKPASRTAWMVNDALLLAARRTPSAALLPTGLRACARGFARAAPPRSRLDRALARLCTGLALHIALRKRYVEDQVRAAIAAGARQVVVLGAGVDSLAMRLAREYAGVAFFEVDHPATQAHKRTLVNGDLHLLAADFDTENLRDALSASPAFRTGARSVFVAEGLLMYLRPAAVDRLFAAVRELGGAGGRLVFSHTELSARGRQRTGRFGGLVRWVLHRRGEPFRSGVPQGTLSAFLAARGLQVLDAPSFVDLRARYALDGRRLADWERLVVANTRSTEPSAG